jgi:hypothetical protein
LRASQIQSFFTQALSGGEESVVALQEKAHTAGLLSEHQSITNSKPFKSAKAALGIRSRRIGFGAGAVWLWVLPATPAPEVTTAGSPDVYDVNLSDLTPDTSPCYAESAGGRPHDAPVEWIRGVNILQQGPRPLGIPPHRWRLFVEDTKQFVASPWARRVAELGWTANELFGSRYTSPHEHLGSSGLLWSMGGGQLVQLHRDGAAFITEDGRTRIFHRRPDRVMAFLPWS